MKDQRPFEEKRIHSSDVDHEREYISILFNDEGDAPLALGVRIVFGDHKSNTIFLHQQDLEKCICILLDSLARMKHQKMSDLINPPPKLE